MNPRKPYPSDVSDEEWLLIRPCWVVERSFGWMARCRRLLRDFERLGEVLTGLHMVAFVGVMLHQVSQLLGNSS